MSDSRARLSDMADGVTSVRLGDLADAVDREAAMARRSRSEMIRFLIEEALAVRQHGLVRQGQGGTLQIDDEPPLPVAPFSFVERFEGCATPELGATYKVTREEWRDDYRERVILDYERTDKVTRRPLGPLADRVLSNHDPRAFAVRLSPQTWEDLTEQLGGSRIRINRKVSLPTHSVGSLVGCPIYLDGSIPYGTGNWQVED